MAEPALGCRWRESSATPDSLDAPDDPDRMAVLRAKAITAALMYGDDSNVVSEDTRTAFVPRVQDHVEAAGEFGIAQDIDDAVELGQSVRKVQLLAGIFTLLLCYRVVRAAPHKPAGASPYGGLQLLTNSAQHLHGCTRLPFALFVTDCDSNIIFASTATTCKININCKMHSACL